MIVINGNSFRAMLFWLVAGYLLSLFAQAGDMLPAFQDVTATLFVSTNDTTETLEDTILLSPAVFTKITDEMKIEDFKKAGYCDNLCGRTGMFIKVCEKTSSSPVNAEMLFIDFGYGCQETSEACIQNGINSICIVCSYGRFTRKFLDDVWNVAIAKESKKAFK